MPTERITVGVLAKKADVSKSVVSAVLNGKDNQRIFVSKKTKEKILSLAHQFGYVPPKSARDLFTGKSNTLGVIVHTLTPFFSEFITQLQQEALKKNLDITLYITNGDPSLEEHYLILARDKRSDATIVVAETPGQKERLMKFSNHPYNLKILAYCPPMKKIPTVHLDEESVGKIAYRHLKEIGCKRLAVLGINLPRTTSFCRTALEDGRTPLRYVINDSSLEDAHQIRKFVTRFLKEVNPLPDGIFCFNDQMALYLLPEIQRKGLRVPEDIAIMGCDNTKICFGTNPTLTTINVNLPLTVQKMVEKIQEMIEGGDNYGPLHTSVPVSLIIRESTKRKCLVA